MNSNEMYHSDILDDILDEVTPQEQSKVEKRMLLAAKISDAMIAKGWKKKDLMRETGQKNQSVITKWLSGTHNFTTETLFDLEEALDVNLVDLSNEKEEKTIAIYHVRVETATSFAIPGNDLSDIIRKSKKQGRTGSRIFSANYFSQTFAEA